MKILFTGGGTGGHFYPIIAIAEAISDIVEKEHLVAPRLYYVAPDPYDASLLRELSIEFRKTPAGKIRRYVSVLNVIDLIKTAAGIIKSVFLLYSIFPDIVFSKGGYASFPVVVAARILGIPVFVHESDSKPGRANQFAGKFAVRIATSFPEAIQYFPSGRAALTGNPIRRDIAHPQKSGAYEFLKLEHGIPVIFVLGGSAGALRINDTILDTLPMLVPDYQIIHQTGEKHYDDMTKTASVVLHGNPHADRYHPFSYLSALAMKMAAGVADIVISRAGSTIFEIAIWGTPSIIVPIPESISHDQRGNAYTYARTGAAVVMEEKNLGPNLLKAEIKRLMDSPSDREEMKKAALEFAKPDAAEKIAKEIISLALTHEK